MAAAVTLSCALLLADADDRRAATAGGVFCVSVDPSRLVGELKEAVKLKKPRDLRHVDADVLLLFLAVQQREEGLKWLSDEHDAALTLEIRGSALHEAVFEMLERPNAALRATKPLSRYLSAEGLSPPGPEQIHLLVVAPPAPLGKRSAAAEPEGEGEIAGKRQMRSRFRGDMDDFADIVDVLDSDAEGTEDYHVLPPARRFEHTPTNQQSSSSMTRLLRDSPSVRDLPAPRPKLELLTNTTGNGLVQPGSVLDSNLFGGHLRRRERDRMRERQLGQVPVSTRQAANSDGSSSLSAFAAKLKQARELLQGREPQRQHTPLCQASNSAGSSAERPIELLDPEPPQQPQFKTEFAAASAICSSNGASALKTERSPPTPSMMFNPPAVAEHGPFKLSRPERDWNAGAAAHPSISTEEMFARLTQYDTESSAETSGDGSFEPSGLASPHDAQSPPAEPELVFSDEQSEFIRLAVEERRNLLLVAPAGYGKSAVINRIMNLLKDSLTSINDQPVCGLCAPTGKAASLIKGRTLHSYLGIGLGRGSVSDWVKRVRSASFLKPTLKALRAVQVILIDEISMVSAQMLDRISQYLQEIRMNKKPFGGVQMILVGDLCQLPPVEGAFMFRSLEYARAKFHAFQFTKCFRQNDPVFVSLLNEVRFARCTEPTLAALRKCTSITPEYANGLRPMMIVSTNKEVDTINERELNALIHERQAEVMTYNVRVSQFANPKKADAYRRADGIPEFVKLSVGCQVVVTQNIGNGIVNGTQGCVTSASSSKIELRLQDNNTATIEYFPYKDPEESDVFLARTLFSYMPVRLGYASTVHKAQGMTLQLLEVDVKRVFAHGQLYTALSRVTDLRGLIVKNLFPGAFICNEAVREFYKDLGKGGDTRETTTPVITEDFFVTAP